jgi:zinc transporter
LIIGVAIMLDQNDLLSACKFDGKGGSSIIAPEDLSRIKTARNTWIHLQLESEPAQEWLREESGLPPIAIDALFSAETRPRCSVIDGGLLVNLRGVNLNPGEEPEDMVSIRIYLDKDRIFSVRKRKLLSVQDIRDELEVGKGPCNSIEFLLDITDRLLGRVGPIIADLDDGIDNLEEQVISNTNASLRGKLWQLRKQAISLRRYISPQRDALAKLVTNQIDWIDNHANQRLRENADRITRYVEDLDSVRERAAIIQDELSTRLSEQMNRNMYLLSIIAGIFLPLSLITGVLGINVGGIPGDKWPWAFTVVTIGIIFAGVIEYFLFRRLKWI